jgi:hypothetical protein
VNFNTAPHSVVALLGAIMLLIISDHGAAQKPLRLRHDVSGVFALGIRSGVSISTNDGWNVYPGLGAQARIMAARHFNTEWYFEFYHGGFTDQAVRTDGHIGTLIMWYPQRRPQSVAPFLCLGPNADYIRLRDRLNKENFTSRWSIAAQAGIGMHITLTRRSDLTLSTQYMMHFGQPMELTVGESTTVSVPESGSGPDGHFLFNLSMNYKMADLWKRLKL